MLVLASCMNRRAARATYILPTWNICDIDGPHEARRSVGTTCDKLLDTRLCFPLLQCLLLLRDCWLPRSYRPAGLCTEDSMALEGS